MRKVLIFLIICLKRWVRLLSKYIDRDLKVNILRVYRWFRSRPRATLRAFRVWRRDFRAFRIDAVKRSRLVAVKTVTRFWVARFAAKYKSVDLIVVANAYPDPRKEKYGGEFIRSRVESYRKQGVVVAIIELVKDELELPSICSAEARLRIGWVYWDLLNFGDMESVGAIYFHSPRPELTCSVIRMAKVTPVSVFYHGYEVRDYRRLYFNFTTELMSISHFSLVQTHEKRMLAAKRLVECESVRTVFVSNYIKGVAKVDSGFESEPNTCVIPNYIDSEFYAAKKKASEMSKQILLIRSFHQRNYAGDIAVAALLKMFEERPEQFSNLTVTVCGFGRLFEQEVEGLKVLPNVSLRQGYLSAGEMKALFESHGIFLAPTRFDTQGVTMCEAMSSGLVPVVNKLGGIPEFADDSCAVLVRPESVSDFTKGIWRLVDDDIAFVRMSECAAQKVRAVCSTKNTVERELERVVGSDDTRLCVETEVGQ